MYIFGFVLITEITLMGWKNCDAGRGEGYGYTSQRN